MAPVEVRERAIQPVQPLLVAPARAHAEAREEPAPASGRPEELDDDEAGDREGLDARAEWSSPVSTGPDTGTTVCASVSPKHEKEALADDDRGLVHDDGGEAVDQRHPVTAGGTP